MTSDGVNAYTYNAKNQMITGAGASIAYDAEDRLLAITKAGVVTKFLYDGTDIIAEFDNSNNLLRKYVHGEGTDEPLVWYEGSNKYFLHANDQGSIVSTTDINGTTINISTYDAYGKRTASNDNYSSRFSYTGQAYLKEISLYYYKARIYNQNLGRFMQTDPIGYSDGMNWYNYVGSDPVNNSDPSGLETTFNMIGGCLIRTVTGYSSTDGGSTWGSTVRNYNMGCGIPDWNSPILQSPPTPSTPPPTQQPPINQPKGCPLKKPTGEFTTGPNADPRFAPEFADKLSSAFKDLNAQGITPHITSGFRTSQDQMRMRNGGSGSNPAATVSNHQLGMSIDLNSRTSNFPTIVKVMEAHKMTWGGHFKKIDKVHFQLPPAGTSANRNQARVCEMEN